MNKVLTLVVVVGSMLSIHCGGPMGDDLSSADQALKSGGSTTTTTTSGGSTKGGKTSTTTTAPAVTYALNTTDAYGTAPTFSSSFVINQTYDLFFAVDVNGALAGHHSASVFVNLPGGSAYQRLDVAFATDVAAGAGEQQAEKTATGYRVWVSMPVAGTVIEQYQLTGPWTASAFIDAGSTAAASASFSLN